MKNNILYRGDPYEKREATLSHRRSALSVSALVACSQGGKSSSPDNQVFSYVYTQDPDTLDYSLSNKKSTSEFTGNAVDGLLEVDKYGNLIPSLAKDWTVSKDGLTYTYKLRKGVKWVTAEGEEFGEVKAQDFVTGLQHAADKKSSALYLVQQSIKDWMIMSQGKPRLLNSWYQSCRWLYGSIHLEPTRKFLEFKNHHGHFDASQ